MSQWLRPHNYCLTNKEKKRLLPKYILDVELNKSLNSSMQIRFINFRVKNFPNALATLSAVVMRASGEADMGVTRVSAA